MALCHTAPFSLRHPCGLLASFSSFVADSFLINFCRYLLRSSYAPASTSNSAASVIPSVRRPLLLHLPPHFRFHHRLDCDGLVGCRGGGAFGTVDWPCSFPLSSSASAPLSPSSSSLIFEPAAAAASSGVATVPAPAAGRHSPFCASAAASSSSSYSGSCPSSATPMWTRFRRSLQAAASHTVHA